MMLKYAYKIPHPYTTYSIRIRLRVVVHIHLPFVLSLQKISNSIPMWYQFRKPNFNFLLLHQIHRVATVYLYDLLDITEILNFEIDKCYLNDISYIFVSSWKIFLANQYLNMFLKYICIIQFIIYYFTRYRQF